MSSRDFWSTLSSRILEQNNGVTQIEESEGWLCLRPFPIEFRALFPWIIIFHLIQIDQLENQLHEKDNLIRVSSFISMPLNSWFFSFQKLQNDSIALSQPPRDLQLELEVGFILFDFNILFRSSMIADPHRAIRTGGRSERTIHSNLQRERSRERSSNRKASERRSKGSSTLCSRRLFIHVSIRVIKTTVLLLTLFEKNSIYANDGSIKCWTRKTPFWMNANDILVNYKWLFVSENESLFNSMRSCDTSKNSSM